MVKKWLQQLRRWIRRLLKPRQKRSSHPRIIKRWYGTNCAVFRIERDTPGGISTYRVIPRQGNYDYLFTLDYLPELQAELVGEINGTVIKLRYLGDTHHLKLTHRFAVFRLQRNGAIHPIGIWDVDLEGVGTRSNALRQIAPLRAIFGLALHTLAIPHNPNKSPSLTWESQIERVDWLGLLQQKISEELQNPNHNLRACVILPNSTPH